ASLSSPEQSDVRDQGFITTEQAQSGGRGQGQAAMEHGTWNMERESRQETGTGPSTEAAEKLRNREWGLQIRSILVASG
ncbi:hypothetical protein C6P42_004941, partial [Pichia californica]